MGWDRWCATSVGLIALLAFGLYEIRRKNTQAEGEGDHTILRGSQVPLVKNGSQVSYLHMPRVRGEPMFPRRARLLSLEWRTQRVIHPADIFGGSHSFLIFTLQLGSQLQTYRMEKSNHYVHVCPNKLDGSCIFRSFDSGRLFLSAGRPDIRSNLNFTDWLDRAQDHTPQNTGYHPFEWNCHNFAKDLWNAAVGRHRQFTGIPNQNVLWLYRRLIFRSTRHDTQDDDKPLGTSWLTDHIERRRLSAKWVIKRIVMYAARVALRKLAKKAGKMALRRMIRHIKKGMKEEKKMKGVDLFRKDEEMSAAQQTKALLTEKLDEVREDLKDRTEDLAKCVWTGTGDPSTNTLSVLKNCMEEQGLVPISFCGDGNEWVFKLLADTVEPEVAEDIDVEDWRKYAKSAEVTFTYQMDLHDISCTSQSRGVYPINPTKFTWDGERVRWDGKPILNTPRNAPFFRLHQQVAARRENEKDEEMIPEMCVGSSVKGGCRERDSCNTRKIGDHGGTSDSQSEFSSSIASMTREGDSKFTVHAIPRIGESLQRSVSIEQLPMKQIPLCPGLFGSTCSSSGSPEVSDSSCLDAAESTNTDGSAKSSPFSDKSHCDSCNSWRESSGSCWDSNLFDSSGSSSHSSWESSPDTKTGPTCSESCFGSSGSSLGTTPFTKSSCGNTATDIDCSGTVDGTGTLAAHKQCLFTPEECAAQSCCVGFSFSPRAIRVNLKQFNVHMQEMVDQRMEEERGEFNAEKESWCSPKSRGPSGNMPEDAERCADIIPEQAEFKDDGDDDKWDCPFSCKDGKAPVNGSCKDAVLRRLSKGKSAAWQPPSVCEPGLGAVHCNCSELRFGPQCSDDVVAQAEVSQQEQCDGTDHDYCFGFAASLLYALEHPWCNSNVTGCLDGHRLRASIEMNWKLQLAGAVTLLVLVGSYVAVTLANALSWTSWQPSSLLVLTLGLYILQSLLIAIFLEDLPDVAKRLYFAWCYSNGLPSEILAQLHFTFEATVDLAYARVCFAVAGICAVGIHACWASACASAKVVRSVVFPPFAWIWVGARSFAVRIAVNPFKYGGNYLLFVANQVPTKFPQTMAVAAGGAAMVSAFTNKAKAAALSPSTGLSNKLQRFKHSSVMESICQSTKTVVQVGVLIYRKIATPGSVLQLFLCIVVFCMCYLQLEDLWQNAAGMEDDFTLLTNSLVGHTLPDGHACIQVNSKLHVVMNEGLLKNGTIAQLLS